MVESGKSKGNKSGKTTAYLKTAQGWGPAGRTVNPAQSDWRKTPAMPSKAERGEFQGIQVFYPVDPYTNTERKQFRAATSNVYLYRALRILTNFVCGQGYTTKIVPRIEEDLTEEEEELFRGETTYVPYWDEEITFDELKDRIDKMAIDMNLAENVFNGYITSLEQGRCVLALTPLDYNEETGKYGLPQEVRYIRPEFTLRPILDANTAELLGCYIIGSRSTVTPDSIPSNRMIYITHGFNRELFSDYYGDSKVARISDIANNLNLVLEQDYERVAEQTWHKPNTWVIPIAPQDIGNEESIVQEFLTNLNQNSKGRDIAVTTSATTDDKTLEKITNTNNAGDIGGLEVIRGGLIKAIITAFGIPAFMLSEGDFGRLGGNANIEEVDMFLNTEVTPERAKLENILEKQFYDPILCILYDVENPDDLPIKMKHKYNKPTLLTLLPSDMINSLQILVQNNWIDESSLLEILHLEKYRKETMTKGEDIDPNSNKTRGWNDSWSQKEGIDEAVEWGDDSGWAGEGNDWTNRWGKSPMGSWFKPSERWAKGLPPPKIAKLKKQVKIAKQEKKPTHVPEKPTTNKSPLGKLEPTEKDLQDPDRKIEWAKIEAAKELSKALKEDEQ